MMYYYDDREGRDENRKTFPGSGSSRNFALETAITDPIFVEKQKAYFCFNRNTKVADIDKENYSYSNERTGELVEEYEDKNYGNGEENINDLFEDDIESFLAKHLERSQRDGYATSSQSMERLTPARTISTKKERNQSNVNSMVAYQNSSRRAPITKEQQEKNEKQFSSSGNNNRERKEISIPGAYAVYGIQNNERENNFASSDNFVIYSAESRAMPSQHVVSKESPNFNNFCTTKIDEVNSDDDISNNENKNKLLSAISARKGKIKLSILILVLVIISVTTIALTLSNRSRNSSSKANSSVTTAQGLKTLAPSSIVPTFPPIILPLNMEKTQSFDGESIGYSLEISGDLLVTSNGSSIYTFDFAANESSNNTSTPRRIDYIVDGETVSLSNAGHRMVVKNDNIVSIHDYNKEEMVWEQVEKLVLDSIYIVAIVSGDGNTVLISYIVNERILTSRIYRKRGSTSSKWTRYGKDIEKPDQYEISGDANKLDINNALSYNGDYISFGARRKGASDNDVSYTFHAPSDERGEWKELHNIFGLGYGPFVFMDDAGQRLITGGSGRIYTQSINDLELNRGDIIRYNSVETDDLILALSKDGHRIAYYSDDDFILIMEWNTEKDKWTERLPKLQLENTTSVKDLSFSADGTKLIVGMPEIGRVLMYEEIK